MVKITEEKMQRYENVRSSGITNMFDLNNVMVASGLTKEECIDIMQNYGTYMSQFGIERK